jgi:hypothetical protein
MSRPDHTEHQPDMLCKQSRDAVYPANGNWLLADGANELQIAGVFQELSKLRAEAGGKSSWFVRSFSL